MSGSGILDGTSRCRRAFLGSFITGTGGIMVAGLPRAFAAEPGEMKPAGEPEVAPAEDLMREHGLLNRILLIYDDYVRKLESPGSDLQPEVLAAAVGIIRNFVEDYHEKLEEDFLFPRFRKAGKEVELVDVLQAQHEAGRKCTEQIQELLKSGDLKNTASSKELSKLLRSFVRMYRPHEAREDTVLFPAFKTIVSPKEYASLGEEFEDKEHQLFGEEGFEKMVSEVAGLEKKLGIYELAQFTPRV